MHLRKSTNGAARKHQALKPANKKDKEREKSEAKEHHRTSVGPKRGGTKKKRKPLDGKERVRQPPGGKKKTPPT